MIKTLTHALPAGYTELEYITAATAGPYIQLNKGFDATDEIEIKTKLGNTNRDRFLVSPTTWNTSNNRFAMGGTNVSRCVGFGQQTTNYTLYSPLITPEVGQITTETYSNRLFTITGENINSTVDVTSTGFGTETDKLKLFYGYNATTQGSIYYWKHKKLVDGVLTLVEDLVPAERTSDNAIGMYDLVSKTFFTNDGTGDFTAGPEVTTPTKALKQVHELYKKNKNLFNNATAVNGDLNSATGGVNICLYRAISDFIKVKKGQTYMASGSFNMVGSSTLLTASFIIARYDANQNFIAGSRTVTHFPYTIPNDTTEYLRLEAYENNSSTGTVELSTMTIQLEEGSTATSYIPYGVDYIGELYQKNPEWVVPDGYTQLEYLEATGEQYIDTGFAPLPSDEFEGKICVTENNSNGCFFGASNKFSWAVGNPSIALSQTTDKKAYFRYGNNPTTIICLTTADTPINISLKGTTLTIGDNIETITRESSWSSTVPTLHLFNRHAEIIGSSTFVKGRIYYLKWFSNNILVRNMIPAKNSSNVLGMYDIVNNQFYTNAGTGNFEAGPEIPKLLHTFSAGYDTQITGTSPLTLQDARAKNTTWKIDGQSSQDGTPTPTTPIDVNGCGNEKIRPNQQFNIAAKSTSTSIWGCTMTPKLTDGSIHLTGTGTVSDYANSSGLSQWYPDGSMIAGHVYYVDMKGLEVGSMSPINIRLDGASRGFWTNPIIFTRGSDGNFIFSWNIVKDRVYDTTFTPQIIDLTILYGAGNEPTTVAEFKQRLGVDEIPIYSYSATNITYYEVPVKVSGGTTEVTHNITLPAPLQKIGTYKDSIESDGTLTRGVGVKVLDGTENWGGSSYFTLSLTDMASLAYGPGYCTHGEVSSENTRLVQLGSNNNISYWCEKVKPEGVTDVTTWKAWLAAQYAAGTPVIIYYPLATPTETTIEVPTISTNKGSNIFNVETNIEPSNVDVTYRKKTK